MRARLCSLSEFAAWFALTSVATGALPEPAPRAVDFARDIEPIFGQCIGCHGPEKQKSDYRLDDRVTALKGGQSEEAAILPGRSAESPLIQFVAGLDGDMVMPPKNSDKPRLTPEQISLLRAWIDQGAVWPEDAAKTRVQHWSFKPITRLNPPQATGPNSIDRFILARLDPAGLGLSHEADRRTLIRRLSFDLIGLPPIPEEVTAFTSDPDPHAYEKLVERLLGSPHYGERWARHWLDVVRFAESDGFETNQPRSNAWRYRDYVIRAFNDDVPYDQFIREQLAGDAFGADEATGFLVAGPFDRVKSPDPALTANQRADELQDMVSAVGSTLLGLTVNCARCHNHKFDPISQVDYYSMVACVSGVQHGDRQLRGTNDEGRRRKAEALRLHLAELTMALDAMAPIAQPDAITTRRAMVNARRNVERLEPILTKRLRFTATETNSGAEPCLDEIELWTGDTPPRNVAIGAHVSSSGNYEGDPKHQLAYINDGQYGNGRSWISNTAGRGWVEFELAQPERIARIVWARDCEERYKDRLAIRYTIEMSEDGFTWRVVANSNDRAPFKNDAPPQPEWESPAVDADQRAGAVKLETERGEVGVQIVSLTSAPRAYAGRFEQPPRTRRLHRGDPMQSREEVMPAALTQFGGRFALTADAPEQQRRVALANWIADPQHPLTARVMVNRLWQHHFGRGLVETPSDFGLNGARPTHPELLDWLASEFIAQKWSVKAMQRVIVMSATYRQSSTPNENARTVDADTRLLWRFPPQRLEAEPLRDTILAITGKLDLQSGGPGFDLFEPNTNYVKVYNARREFAADAFRRMIYWAKPRMQLDDTFGAFDCPDAGQTAPRRNRSTTPLQALALLNSPFLLQQAGFFAERLEREAGNDRPAQVRRAFALAFGREPSTGESAAAEQFIAMHGLPAFCRALLNATELLTVL